MNSNPASLTENQFHQTLHQDINKPAQNYVVEYRDNPSFPFGAKVPVQIPTGAHELSWADAYVYTGSREISVQVYLNYKQNDLSDADFKRLKALASKGIEQYWSRKILVSGQTFQVWVWVFERENDAVDVDLYLETDPGSYGRSMNPDILGIDASFKFNKGYYQNYPGYDELDFKLVAAHEFGHSVLKHAGGITLSWGHKGTANVLLQSVKSSTPGYPASGPIDLMKYYDSIKSQVSVPDEAARSEIMEEDVKRLIGGAKLKWMP